MSFCKKLLLLVTSLTIGATTLAKSPEEGGSAKYFVTINLTQVKDDKLKVSVRPPGILQSEIVYNMPKMVPGTYSISDFGKFVTAFKAYDKSGKLLEVEQLDANRWRIKNATTLHEITYWVDDTFDTPKKEDVIFEPAGTNIEEGKNFLLNTFGFIGYFDNMKLMPYELRVEKPDGFYGSTPLQAVSSTATADRFEVDSYVDLADSPLMYNKPDTTVLVLGNTEVLVSVYSPSGKITSKPIAADVLDILQSQRNYLGGTLPVNKYAFIIYVPEKIGKSGAFGALEHSYSSVYFLPEMPENVFSAKVRDVASHEFFHIITPLSIHSEEIGDFDFINPKMSKHLWLYEGVTEYFATHVQAFEKLISPEDYMAKLQDYIFTSKRRYNDTLPFTQMSAQVLTKYEKEYGNVYQKGALIGLVLDVRLRELSDGKYGLRNLMHDLSLTYGKHQSFKDEELFDKIAALTYPQIREFFTLYVEGSQKLPLEETFRKVGVQFKTTVETVNSYGGFTPGYDKVTDAIKIADTEGLDTFGKKIGFRKGDLLLAMNGTNITVQNVSQILGVELQEAAPGDKIEFTVGRLSKGGKIKKKKLKGKVTTIDREALPELKLAPNATDEQLKLRAAWLNS